MNIYILSLNCSLDYFISLDAIDIGVNNNLQTAYYLPGSKGINVGLCLYNLGIKPNIFGFVDNSIGSIIKDYLDSTGVNFHSIGILDKNRINIKIKTIEEETEITGVSPLISLKEQQKMLASIKDIKDDDILVLSGRLPRGVDDSFYAKIMSAIPDKTKVFLDCKGIPLKLAIQNKPYLVKPNINELEEYFGCNISKENLIEYGQKLLKDGAKNVIISLGEEGSLFVNDKLKYFIKPINGQLISSVGAGDSMVAGFIYGVINNLNTKDCFKWANACGIATAYSKGIAKIDKVKEIFNLIFVQEL
jgi:1-phosphofructokinase